MGRGGAQTVWVSACTYLDARVLARDGRLDERRVSQDEDRAAAHEPEHEREGVGEPEQHDACVSRAHTYRRQTAPCTAPFASRRGCRPASARALRKSWAHDVPKRLIAAKPPTRMPTATIRSGAMMLRETAAHVQAIHGKQHNHHRIVARKVPRVVRETLHGLVGIPRAADAVVVHKLVQRPHRRETRLAEVLEPVAHWVRRRRTLQRIVEHLGHGRRMLLCT